MLDSVFAIPPVFDDSYYGFAIHEIREMAVMNMGNYAHGNQPIQHMIYLYDTVGRPWKAQRRVRQVMDALYSPAPTVIAATRTTARHRPGMCSRPSDSIRSRPDLCRMPSAPALFRRATLTFEDGRRLAIGPRAARPRPSIYARPVSAAAVSATISSTTMPSPPEVRSSSRMSDTPDAIENLKINLTIAMYSHDNRIVATLSTPVAQTLFSEPCAAASI